MIYQALFTLLLFLGLSNPVSAEENWKIGVMLCLSGECASSGQNALKGAQLAVEELNLKGGVLGRKLKLVVQDTNEAVSGAKAVSAFRQLRSNNEIRYFVGPTWTPAGLALAPILKQDHDVIATSPSLGVAGFHEASENTFNTYGTDEFTTRRSARFAYAQGYRRISVFSSKQPWESLQASFFQDEFEELGGDIVAKVEPLPTEQVLNIETIKLVSANPEAIFIAALGQQSVIAKELRKLNFSGAKFAALVDEARLKEADGALEGTAFFTYQMPTSEFKEKFASRFGVRPEISAATAYDTIYAYSIAVEMDKSFDVGLVKKNMLKLNFQGASGQIRFDSEGCVKKEASGWFVSAEGFEAINLPAQ